MTQLYRHGKQVFFMLKRIINQLFLIFGRPSIPRRPLTYYSTDILRKTLTEVIAEMLRTSCPCHYPRYRFLVTFNHKLYDTGPVSCAETNYLTSLATNEELNYLEQVGVSAGRPLGDYGDDIIYRCRKCSTQFRHVASQYSINFEFEYLIIEDIQFQQDVGCPLSLPMPLYQGLYGFKDGDILKCAMDFKLSNPNKLLKYLTCKL